METFDKKLAILRKEKKLSQTDLAKQLNTSVSVISRYERDEMTPSIDAAKKLAKILDTTVGYLLGEDEQANLFRDKKMLKRLQDIMGLPEKEKDCLITTIDHFIKAAKINMI